MVMRITGERQVTSPARVLQAIGGLSYFADVLTADEEEALIEHLLIHEQPRWVRPRLRGQDALRAVACYGWDYTYAGRSLRPAPAIPSYLLPVRGRCAQLCGIAPERLEQVIVTAYPPGAGIGRHIDAPVFAEPVLSLSLGAQARITFRRFDAAPLTLALAPRSVLVLRGESRTGWSHEIRPVRATRYSLTFRVLAQQCEPASLARME